MSEPYRVWGEFRGFCVDCRHYGGNRGGCLNPSLRFYGIHFKTGEAIKLRVLCSVARKSGPCGPDGLLFEPKVKETA